MTATLSTIKPLQCIQNAATGLVFNLPIFSHVITLIRDLHWLPVIARIRFKTLVLAYKAVSGTAPTYLQTLVRPHAPLRSTTCSMTGTAFTKNRQTAFTKNRQTLLCQVPAVVE